jgi:hypothetical protein
VFSEKPSHFWDGFLFSFILSKLARIDGHSPKKQFLDFGEPIRNPKACGAGDSHPDFGFLILDFGLKKKNPAASQPGPKSKVAISAIFCRNELQKCRKQAFRVSFSAIFKKLRLLLHLT